MGLHKPALYMRIQSKSDVQSEKEKDCIQILPGELVVSIGGLSEVIVSKVVNAAAVLSEFHFITFYKFIYMQVLTFYR